MSSLTQEQYFHGVQILANEIIDEARSQEPSDLEEFIQDLAPDMVDADEWILYTHYHAKILEFSSNDEAYLGIYSHAALGGLVASRGVPYLIQTMAYFAYAQDVSEAIAEILESEG